MSKQLIAALLGAIAVGGSYALLRSRMHRTAAVSIPAVHDSAWAVARAQGGLTADEEPDSLIVTGVERKGAEYIVHFAHRPVALPLFRSDGTVSIRVAPDGSTSVAGW